MALGVLTLIAVESLAAPDRPNFILCMADDLGWADTDFNGSTTVATPNLDRLAGEGLVFRRFYSASPVCSPTRGSCLTGRHPDRYGIVTANAGSLPAEEINLANLLRDAGYTTGHFGKWHLGTLTTTLRESNRGGPRGADHYAPPWDRGFDTCFSTEAKVPTWDPMHQPGTKDPYGTNYWTGPGERVTENLDGDDSRVIMDRAVEFVEQAARNDTPFLAVIWFHAPHLPTVAGPEHRALYKSHPLRHQHYYGCITALDDQMGRLRQRLIDLGIGNDTLLWFASDNGPESRTAGSAGPFRERKRSLHEGGVRVPAFAWQPGSIEPGETDFPAATSDYLPTTLDLLDIRYPSTRPLDGVSLVGAIQRAARERGRSIGFRFQRKVAWVTDRHKLISKDAGQSFELYDLINDPGEEQDLAEELPDLVAAMRGELDAWRASCAESAAGGDY